jgi:glucose/mannose-6-phosphate isomerase
MTASSDLRAEEIARVDRSHQVEDVLALPAHLHDALWRVGTAGLEGYQGSKQLEGCEALLVCGMGGSAVGGDLAAAALGHRLTRPLITVRGYELPSWTTPDSVVLCSSYSGNTEETLACYEAAAALGAMRIVATTGGALADAARADHIPVIPLPAGLQPRAAVAYMLVSTLEVAAFANVAPALRTEIDRTSDELSQLTREWGPDSDPDSLAKQVAQRGRDACLCVYGAGPTAIAAYRWKTQINENSKVPAFAAELPEADHNEIVGWEEAAELGSFLAVFLEDTDQHPRTRRRIDLTEGLVAPKAAGTLRIESRGESPLSRLLSLVLLGDLVSIYLAVLRGIDPTPVKMIDQLKAELARSEVA